MLRSAMGPASDESLSLRNEEALGISKGGGRALEREAKMAMEKILRFMLPMIRAGVGENRLESGWPVLIHEKWPTTGSLRSIYQSFLATLAHVGLS